MTEKAFALARERYSALGVDVEAALERLRRIPISLHSPLLYAFTLMPVDPAAVELGHGNATEEKGRQGQAKVSAEATHH